MDDGIALLPNEPGIYCILNRVTGRRGVGLASRSIQSRAKEHRRSFSTIGTCSIPIARDLEQHGSSAFIFLTLEVCRDDRARNHLITLKARELWWAEQLLTFDESTGYNLEAGGVRSPASRLREHERKLLRSNSRRYQFLPDVKINDPIQPELLKTWVAASNIQAAAGSV